MSYPRQSFCCLFPRSLGLSQLADVTRSSLENVFSVCVRALAQKLRGSKLPYGRGSKRRRKNGMLAFPLVAVCYFGKRSSSSYAAKNGDAKLAGQAVVTSAYTTVHGNTH